MQRMEIWKRGFRDGIPIFLGYLAVSFSFGIVARGSGLSVFQAVLMSSTNFTSAGQFAALDVISSAAPYLELALVQLIINLRYCLMSCVISQKVDPSLGLRHRLIMSFGLSDEIFGVSSSVEGKLSPYYTFGAMSAGLPGWVLGTFLGALSGTALPARALSALGVALFSMFLALILPNARQNKIIFGIVTASMLLSFVFSVTPGLKMISSGFKIIILSIVIAGASAFLFPIKEDALPAAPTLTEESNEV